MNCKHLLLAPMCVFLSTVYSKAQYESPVAYMGYLNQIESDLGKDYMSYFSAMAHANSPRKLEKRRAEVINTVKEGRNKVNQLKAYDGKTDLRDAYGKYLTILQALLTEDYAKIVNMEEIAEQSYDQMEAYLLAQEKANEKLAAASDSLGIADKQFAVANNVRLVESENKINTKLARTGKVMEYYNSVYLVYFKTTKQEAYTIAAMNKDDVNGIEQNKNTQVKYAVDGLKKLNSIKPFEGDNTIVVSCRNLLTFQKDEGENKISILIDFLLKKEEFNKFKAGYETKPQSERTNDDVNAYNAIVKDMNKMGDQYNLTNKQLNEQRFALMEKWSGSVKTFLDNHIPDVR